MRDLREDFPLLRNKELDGRNWVYLDSASTTQKPQVVLDAIMEFYTKACANPYRGAYELGETATLVVENTREQVRKFLNARNKSEIIFTKNTTDAINLVARGMVERFKADDEIVLAISEHHSNLLPWQNVAKICGAKLVFLETDKNGEISDEEITEKIGVKTRLVAVAQVSNVSGKIYPIKKIAKVAHENGALVLVDAAQAVGHFAIDVQDLDADFLAFSGHKMFAEMGVGVLYGKLAELDNLAPSTFGGGMIEYVERFDASFAGLTARLEAGTHDAGAIASLLAAVDYIRSIGLGRIWEHEQKLTGYLLDRLATIPGVMIIGGTRKSDRSGVVSFTIEGAHPHDLATLLGAEKIAIRAGHHCAQPFMQYLSVNSTARASLHLYNNKDDVERLIAGIKLAKEKLG